MQGSWFRHADAGRDLDDAVNKAGDGLMSKYFSNTWMIVTMFIGALLMLKEPRLSWHPFRKALGNLLLSWFFINLLSRLIVPYFALFRIVWTVCWPFVWTGGQSETCGELGFLERSDEGYLPARWTNQQLQQSSTVSIHQLSFHLHDVSGAAWRALGMC